MVLQVTSVNDVKVYHVTSGKSIPEWIAIQKKKSLRYDQGTLLLILWLPLVLIDDGAEFRSRIELLQDFEFPGAALKIRQTADGAHLLAVGVYKPQVRAYELSQLSMKFERHMDCEPVQMELLGDDWTKLAFLQLDRTLEIHSQGGLYYKTRVPKVRLSLGRLLYADKRQSQFGRDMVYQKPSCDLLIGGVGSEVWRLNLDQGRYLNAYATACTSVNVTKLNPVHSLAAFGGEDGLVEFWDTRMRKALGKANVGVDTMSNYVEYAHIVFASLRLTKNVRTKQRRVAARGLFLGLSPGRPLVRRRDVIRSRVDVRFAVDGADRVQGPPIRLSHQVAPRARLGADHLGRQKGRQDLGQDIGNVFFGVLYVGLSFLIANGQIGVALHVRRTAGGHQ